MKKTYTIPPDCATNIAAGYQKAQSAIEFFRAAKATPGTPAPVQNSMVDVVTSLTLLLENKIDKRIPRQTFEAFADQVKNNDALRFEEITRIYHRLPPEKQAVAEDLLTALMKGEIELFDGTIIEKVK